MRPVHFAAPSVSSPTSPGWRSAKEALRRVDEELSAIFDAYPDTFFRLSADGTILQARAGAATEPEIRSILPDFIGHRPYDLVPPPGGERLRQAIEEVGRTRSTVTTEYDIGLPDGEHVREARHVPLSNGEILGIVRDITARKRAEQQIAALSTRLLQVQDEERRRIAARPARGIRAVARRRQDGRRSFAGQACRGGSEPRGTGRPVV